MSMDTGCVDWEHAEPSTRDPPYSLRLLRVVIRGRGIWVRYTQRLNDLEFCKHRTDSGVPQPFQDLVKAVDALSDWSGFFRSTNVQLPGIGTFSEFSDQ